MTDKRKSPVACTSEIYELVISSLHQGITLAKLLQDNENNLEFPSRGCILTFINADNARKSAYAHAREDCADSLAEQTLIEADNILTDPARASNRVKARQWLASKIKPKVYGDKLDVDITGKIDVSSAILLARQRINRLPEPMIIDQEPDPFS